MKKYIENTEEIISRHVSGFHIYDLTAPYHLVLAGESLCEMTGFSADELQDECFDLYAARIHPSDREPYADFLARLSSEEQTLSLQYRIIKKDGTVCYVSDSMTSKRLGDGSIAGYSVLTDITELKKENEHLKFLNETIPCGFLKYTCDKQPKITYINEEMLSILRLPDVKDGELSYIDIYRENMFLMIPMEDHGRFSKYLERVYKEGAPVAGEMTVLRCDGTRARLFGWVTKVTGHDGVEEFQSVCMDVTERYDRKKRAEEQKYLKALAEVYDNIFEYDLSAGTVRCLYERSSEMFKWLEGIPMQMREATTKWVMGTVCEEDRDAVCAFFDDFYRNRDALSDAKPSQIKYRARSSNGELQGCTGIFLKLDASVSLFCCRSVAETDENDQLRNENIQLKNMQELVMRYSDGIAAFEVKNEYVTPLYASDNVCEFFGFSKEEWLPMMERSTPLREFVSRSGVAFEDFAGLLANGEAEFIYYDLKLEKERSIKAICTQKSEDAGSPRYVMLYKLDETKSSRAGGEDSRTVRIRTFGYFDVFVNDKPIAFRNEKSKELFALLVDRRGGFVTSDEAIGFLWEDEPATPVTLSRYRKVALRLKNILEEYGISDIVESVNGKRRIATDKVSCDLYDYLSGKEEYAALFKGSYLTNYSWGENTLAELAGDGNYNG